LEGATMSDLYIEGLGFYRSTGAWVVVIRWGSGKWMEMPWTVTRTRSATIAKFNEAYYKPDTYKTLRRSGAAKAVRVDVLAGIKAALEGDDE
jgi:hypothetical protein